MDGALGCLLLCKLSVNGGGPVNEEERKYTIVGTDIEAVKEQARKSGLSYNEAIEFIAKTTGGRGTNVYSNTNVEAVKRENEQSENTKQQYE